MKKYNKLVRDKIPSIIESEGRKVHIKILSNEDFKTELNKKLLEEVNEYINDNNIEELADIVEVIYGILKTMNKTCDDLESVRVDKVKKRGAFENKIFLIDSE